MQKRWRKKDDWKMSKNNAIESFSWDPRFKVNKKQNKKYEMKTESTEQKTHKQINNVN